jgi:hypothetical protein
MSDKNKGNICEGKVIFFGGAFDLPISPKFF